MISCGKKNRKRQGNRWAAKRANRTHRASDEKRTYWQTMEAERLRQRHESRN